jgi:hypothetical protein
MPKRQPPTNPFRYGDLALDDQFTDRAAELKALKADIRNGQNVVIFAPRRYGKSSLVWRAAQELTARREVLIAYVDLLATPSKEKLAEKLAKSIHDNVASPLLRAREKTAAIFDGLRVRPTVTLNPHDASLSFTFDSTGRREDIDATLERLLELPGQLAADRRKSTALVFDEFQEILDIDSQLPALLRTTFQRQPDVAHVYLGSKRTMMERLFNDTHEPFWRSAKQMELGLIDPELFRPFVDDRFDRTNRAIEDAVLDELLAVTGGHPYATQELCYFLWEEVPEGWSANLETLERAVAGVLRSESAHFTRIWSRAVPNHRLILQALAVDPPARITDGYRRRHSLPHDATVRKALRAMGDDELVLRDDRGYRIAEPFLAEWIRRFQS